MMTVGHPDPEGAVAPSPARSPLETSGADIEYDLQKMAPSLCRVVTQGPGPNPLRPSHHPRMAAGRCLLVFIAAAHGWHLPAIRHGAVAPRVRLAATEDGAVSPRTGKKLKRQVVEAPTDALEAAAVPPPSSAADAAPVAADAEDEYDFEAAFAQRVSADGGRLGVQAKAAASRLEREQKRATLQTKSNLKSASRGAQEQAAVATRDWRFWVAIIAALSLLPVLLRG